MKKMIFIFFVVVFLPINVFAYSLNLIPGGESIGIKINTDGLLVTGFYKVNGEYIAKKTIKVGDRIIKINGINVTNSDELANVIDKEMVDDCVDVEIIRNNRVISTKMYLGRDGDIYKTGLYIKDSIVGIGTLTYIDPITKIYGALGHEIRSNETNTRVEIKDGDILYSSVDSINKSRDGFVGSKNATISYKNILGEIKENTNSGIFGEYTDNLPNKSTLRVATYDEIELGDAYILTVIDDTKINKYDIKILDKYNRQKDTQKAFSFEIVSTDLIKKTGGVVQGMSGSPIIQNNKIIGAVTNVLIDDVSLGYGISIITMLEEGEN